MDGLSSGSRVVPSGQRYRRTDIAKPIVDFRNSASVPKNVTNGRYSGFSLITDPCNNELTRGKFFFWDFVCMLVGMTVKRCLNRRAQIVVYRVMPTKRSHIN